MLRPSAAARAGECKLALAASLPLTEGEQGSKLLVDVTVDGSPVRLVLDTGSEGILLNEVVARRVSRTAPTGSLIGGLDETQAGFSSGVGGSRSVSVMQIGNLGLGRLHGSFRAQATNQSFAEYPADGLLGMSVMGDFDVDLNLPGHQVRLYSASGACGNPAVALDEPIYAVPMQTGYHSQLRPLIPVLLNGQRFTALLDTGAPGVLLFASTASRLGLAAGGSTTRIKIAGVGGEQAATLSQLQTLAVGPITLRNVRVAIDSEDNQEADLLLGLDFMQRVHVWISNSSHTLVMQYPPAPSPQIAGGN